MCCIYTFSCAGAVLFIPFLAIALTFAAVAYFSAKGLANDFTAGDKCGFGYPLAMQTLTVAAGLPSSSNFPAPPPGTCGSIALCSLVQGNFQISDLIRRSPVVVSGCAQVSICAAQRFMFVIFGEDEDDDDDEEEEEEEEGFMIL